MLLKVEELVYAQSRRRWRASCTAATSELRVRVGVERARDESRVVAESAGAKGIVEVGK